MNTADIRTMVERAMSPQRIDTRHGLQYTGTLRGGAYRFALAYLVDGVLYDDLGYKVRGRWITYPEHGGHGVILYTPNKSGTQEHHWAGVKERT